MIYFIYVLKMGGSVLTDPIQIKQAVETIKKIYAEGNNVVVVVSAMKGETNRLDDIANKLEIKDDQDRAEIISMGERVSARVMVATLRSNGIDAALVDPTLQNWPIFSTGSYLDADVDLERTRSATEERIVPLLKQGKVPVVCGFIGVNEKGEIQTLGRGGSDTTAVVLGTCLKAKEVVLFKDVGIAMSGDPKKAQNVKVIHELDADEALALSAGGSGLIHYKAFKYLDGVIRITSLNDGLNSGTIISPANNMGVNITDKNVSMITVIPSSESDEALTSFNKALQSMNVKVYGLVYGQKAILAYVSSEDGIYGNVHDILVKEGVAKAVSVISGLSEITVKSLDLEATPGYMSKLVSPLAESGINLYGVSTISSTIKIYVSSARADEALTLIKGAMGV
ncbi:MAG: aspartate kinase [Nitrososphaeria archaeon]